MSFSLQFQIISIHIQNKKIKTFTVLLILFLKSFLILFIVCISQWYLEEFCV